MKHLVSRWTCDRCGATKDERGDKGIPVGWRTNTLELHQDRRGLDLCNACVRELGVWVNAGMTESAEVSS